MSLWIKNSLKIALAIGLIAWLYRSGLINLADLKELLTPSNSLLCLLILATTMILASERWRVILLAQGFYLTRWNSFKLTLIGLFFNFAVPGGVGGDVVKGYYLLRQNQDRKFLSAFTIFLDRLIGLFAMSLMAVAALTLDLKFIFEQAQLRYLAIFLILLLAAFLVAGAVGFSKTIRNHRMIHAMLLRVPGHHRIFQLWDSFLGFRQHKWDFVWALVLSLLSQIGSIFIFIKCGQQLGYDVPLYIYFVIVPIGFMLTAIPISPAGVGVGQAAFLLLFTAFTGTKNNLGPTAFTAFQMASLSWGLVGALFYMTMKGVRSSNTQTQTT